MTHTFHAGDFTTESGATIPDVTVAYRTWGSPEAQPAGASGGNAVFIGHALTGHPDVMEWWPGLVGPGRVIDPARHFVICANALGSCYGTTGPGTLTPEAQPAGAQPAGAQPAGASGARMQRLGSRFPRITIRDQAGCTRGCWTTSASSASRSPRAARWAGCRRSNSRSKRAAWTGCCSSAWAPSTRRGRSASPRRSASRSRPTASGATVITPPTLRQRPVSRQHARWR